jgi:hypothetical protein
MTTTFTKKQHYIPQFYLKNFSQDNEHIHIYDRAKVDRGEMRYQTTIDIAHENNFYTYQTKDGVKKNLEDMFCQIEGDVANIIQKVRRERVITTEEIEKLALFIGFLYSRTPAFKARTQEMHSNAGEKITRLMFRMTPKERMRKFLKEKKGKDYTDKELDDLIDFGVNPQRSKIGFKYPQGWWIRMMLEMGVKAAEIFFGMDWLFLFTS